MAFIEINADLTRIADLLERLVVAVERAVGPVEIPAEDHNRCVAAYTVPGTQMAACRYCENTWPVGAAPPLCKHQGIRKTTRADIGRVDLTGEKRVEHRLKEMLK